ncbi:MAG: hypothetical protein AB1486_32000 [Planctomycetota bacterium]
MTTKTKEKRRRAARVWVRAYSGPNIIRAYRYKFHVPILTAINDLEALGAELDEREVALIRIDLHHRHVAQVSKKRLQELYRIARVDYGSQVARG